MVKRLRDDEADRAYREAVDERADELGEDSSGGADLASAVVGVVIAGVVMALMLYLLIIEFGGG